MHVRPFFWGFFAFVCLGILAWAAMVPTHQPARLSIHLIQQPTPDRPTSFLVVATDAEGVTIDNAQLVSQAWMTTMPMAPSRISTMPQGQGTYLVQITLNMVGPWMIAVSMQANGFTPLHQMLAVQVLSALASGSAQRENVQAPTGVEDAACAAAMASRVTN